MFEVDIGLQSQATGKPQPNAAASIDLKGQELMQFADVNADMFTDIITVDKARTSVIIHIFDTTSSKYLPRTSFKVRDCALIQNVAVGRSDRTLRLFITCEDLAKKTILRMYDRNMNGELSQP